MKYIYMLITTLIIVSSVYSQKPEKGNFGIGIDYKLQREVHILNPYVYFPNDSYGFDYDYRIESYNYFPALKFDYYLNKTISLNLYYRPSFINKSILNERIEPNNYLRKGIIKFYSMDIGIGTEKHFLREFKIDPFVGINFHYLYSGKENIYTKTVNAYNNHKNINEITKKGVESHGFYSTANFGMNYFILTNFSLGLNLDLGYRYSLQKGENSSTSHSIQYNNGVLIKDETSDSFNKINIENKGFIYAFSIKVAFYLALLKK